MRLLSISDNLSLQDLKIARVVSLLVPVFNTSIYYANTVDRRLKNSEQGKRRNERARAYDMHMSNAFLPRTCPCKRANSSTWWRKTGGRCPLLKSKVASSWSSSSASAIDVLLSLPFRKCSSHSHSAHGRYRSRYIDIDVYRWQDRDTRAVFNLICRVSLIPFIFRTLHAHSHDIHILYQESKNIWK